MAGWRRFERQTTALEYWEIRQEGIRCFLRWGADRRRGTASTSVLNDEEHARRHADRRIKERLRKGFIEVAPPRDPAEDDVETPVLDVITTARGPYAPEPRYLPVEGFDQVYRCGHALDHPMAFYEYFVLRDHGRSAVRFTVRASSHQAVDVASFLEFLCSRRDLAFDGRSHHKLPLPNPVASFDHALFCSPALGGACAAYPAIAARVATAFPIFDCEIGDEDAEVLVDARIGGHAALPHSDWRRAPQPVVDLRFDVQSSFYSRTQTFKVFRSADLEALMEALPQASPQSWVEVRNFRGDVKRLEPGMSPTFAEVLSFLVD